MQSLFEAPAKREILDRLGALSPEAPRQWGKMSVSQMLAHCAVALEAGTGDKPRSFKPLNAKPYRPRTPVFSKICFR